MDPFVSCLITEVLQNDKCYLVHTCHPGLLLMPITADLWLWFLLVVAAAVAVAFAAVVAAADAVSVVVIMDVVNAVGSAVV